VTEKLMSTYSPTMTVTATERGSAAVQVTGTLARLMV
jgi:hypothetical protein